jgi:hypothetical protein
MLGPNVLLRLAMAAQRGGPKLLDNLRHTGEMQSI